MSQLRSLLSFDLHYVTTEAFSATHQFHDFMRFVFTWTQVSRDNFNRKRDNFITKSNAGLYCLTYTGLFYSQLMAVLVCGLRGQHAVRRVGLVPNLEADPVITPPLMLEDKTAQGTSLRRKVVSLRHVLVSNHDL